MTSFTIITPEEFSFKLSYYNEYKSYLRYPVWTSISCCMSEDLGTLIRRE